MEETTMVDETKLNEFIGKILEISAGLSACLWCAWATSSGCTRRSTSRVP
jgi:hypothetical protein